MHPARIAELLAPFLDTSQANDQRLTAPQPATNDALYRNISTYIDILLRWNSRINLTAIRDPEEIVTRHFGESLFAARHLFPDVSATPAAERRQNAAHGESRGSVPFKKQAPKGRKKASPFTEGDQESYEGPTLIRHNGPSEKKGALPLDDSVDDQRLGADDRPSIADVGSGAGFPGIPFKLWNPRINLTLIESNHKKATFLREVVRSLTLTDINVFNGRAEDFPRTQARFDVVTLRAVEHFEAALKISAALLVPGGRLALLIGSSQQDAATKVLPSFSWSSAQPIPLSRSSSLLVGTSPAP
jgi:16S rRNA (guanine(527)-N(7))-methyltransferase RsmG